MYHIHLFQKLFLCLLLIVSSTAVHLWGQAPTITTQQGYPTGTNNGVNGTAYGNGQYILGINNASNPGQMYSSSDGIIWNRINSPSIPSSMVFTGGGAYGNGVFVFAGTNGSIITSSDGVNWTSRNSGTTMQFNDIRFLNGAFYAMGLTGTGVNTYTNILLTSTDGVTWSTLLNLGSSNTEFRSITYGNGVYMLACTIWNSGVHAYRSTTGAAGSWTLITVNLGPNSTNGIFFVKDRFYCFESGSSVFTSTNGSTWSNISGNTLALPNNTSATLGNNGAFFTTGASDGTKYYLFGTHTYYSSTPSPLGCVASSTDGLTFTLEPKTISTPLSRVAYLNGLFIANGGEGVTYSTDGINYKYPGGNYQGIATDGSGHVLVGNGGSANEGVIFNSSSWPAVSFGSPAALQNYTASALASVIHDGSKYVAVGRAGLSATSSNGTSWTVNAGDGDNLNSIAHHNGVYIAVGVQGKIVRSTNGSTWSQINKDGATGSNFLSVRYLNGMFIAVGGSAITTGTARIAYSTDGGNTWVTNNPGITGQLHDIAYDGTRYLLIGRLNSTTAASRTFFSITTSNITTPGGFSSQVSVPAASTGGVPLGNASFGAVIHTNGTFLAVQNQNAAPFQGYILSSTDGSSWTVYDAGTTGRLRAILSTGNVVRVVGTADTRVTVTFPSGNSAPAFTNPANNLTVCQESGATDINTLLTITDTDASQTETFTVTTAPTKGTITSGTTVQSGTNVSPSGWSYTPAPGQSGADAFVIQVSDGNGGTASKSVSVVINPAIVPAVSITSGVPQSICTGQSVAFSATPTNGGLTPGYQWKVNGNNAGTNSTSFNYSPANGDIVTVVLTSNATCASPSSVTSNSLAMTVGTPLVNIAAVQNPVCAGSLINLSATSVLGGIAPAYVWYRNGVALTEFITKYNIPDGLPNNQINAVWATGTRIYAGTQGGLAYSDNKGDSWTIVTSPGLSGAVITDIETFAGTLYVASTAGLFISTDNAVSFTRKTTVNGLSINSVRNVNVTANGIFLATMGGGICYSTDGGSTWTVRNNANSGLAHNGAFDCIEVSGKMYVTHGAGLSYSTNNGISWTNIPGGTAGLASGSGRSLHWEGTTLYVGSAGGVSYSTNGGTSFTARTTAHGLAANTTHKIAYAGGKLYACTDAGVSISTDGGVNFTTTKTTASGLGNNKVNSIFVSGGAIYAATQTGLSLNTRNASISQPAVAGDTYSCILTSNEACVNGQTATSNTIVVSITGYTAIPTAAGTYLANNTCTDGQGWTHYYDTGSQTRLLSINHTMSNGLNWMPGTLVANNNPASGQYTVRVDIGPAVTSPAYTPAAPTAVDVSGAPYISYANYRTMNQTWDVELNNVGQEPEASLRVRSYFTTEGYNAISTAVGGLLPGEYTKLTMYKLKNIGAWYANSADALAGYHANIQQANIQQFNNGISSNAWLYAAVSGNIHSAEYAVNEFSGGGGGGGTGGAAAFPVEWLSFNATPVENQYIRLDWATAAEHNNMGFAIERSSDNLAWEDIGWSDAAGGASNGYQYEDHGVVPDTRYAYRLRQVDIDGHISYSSTVSAALTSVASLALVPNPAHTQVQLSGNIGVGSTLRIYDLAGRIVCEQYMQAGQVSLVIDLNALAPGIYSMELGSWREKLIKK